MRRQRVGAGNLTFLTLCCPFFVHFATMSTGQFLTRTLFLLLLAGWSASALGVDKPAAKPAAAKKSAAPAAKPALPARAVYKPAPSAQGGGVSGGGGLVQGWTPNFELVPYKENYLLLITNTASPNNQPTSGNPLNNIVTPYSYQNQDIQFQISLKHALADFEDFGSVWLGYTQRSFWQYYDSANSRPFRETNYSPELIYSAKMTETSLMNLGLQHESNGESVPRSRSWNRYYVQPMLEIFNTGNERLVFSAQWWDRFKEDPAVDDNPDMVAFAGYREFQLHYLEKDGWDMALTSRINSIKVQISAPLFTWLDLDEVQQNHVNLQLYYFSGFGESLLDYNQSHVTWGFGISFPHF